MHLVTVFLQLVFISLYGLLPSYAVTDNVDWTPLYADMAEAKPDKFQLSLFFQDAKANTSGQDVTSPAFIYHSDTFGFNDQLRALHRLQQRQRSAIIQQQLEQLSFSAYIRFVALYRNISSSPPLINSLFT